MLCSSVPPDQTKTIIFLKKVIRIFFFSIWEKQIFEICRRVSCMPSSVFLSEISLHVHNSDLYLYLESARAYISQSQARVDTHSSVLTLSW